MGGGGNADGGTGVEGDGNNVANYPFARLGKPQPKHRFCELISPESPHLISKALGAPASSLSGGG